MKTNKKYKDSVFTKLFGHDKRIILELYNAIFDANYPEDTPIEITTLENALYMDRINDISFVIDGKIIVLIEHQSTINNNMPLRMLLYISRNYEKIFTPDSIYYQDMIKIPRPEFVVLYNGKKDIPDKSIIKLSDMYERTDNDDEAVNLDLKVKVFNINKGHNPEFIKRSSTLEEYEIFIDTIYENNKEMPFQDAVRQAIKDCKNRGVLVEFLRKHSSEVENMLFENWDLNKALAVREKETVTRSKKEIAFNMKKMGIDVDTIAKATGLFIDDILRL